MKIENKAENDVENEAKNLKIVVFKHLSYSTSYKVEVGIGQSRIIPSLNQCFQRFSVPPGEII